MKSEAINRFNHFLTEFKKTPHWAAMLNTREDSPWHREENVGEHTRMLIDWYQSNLAWKRSDSQQILTLVSCLFHDVGKPSSEIIKYSEERGEYRAYHGHELVSACMWIDFAISNQKLIAECLMFNISDISNIAFFIEHHVPFSIKDENKLMKLKTSILRRTGTSGLQAWQDLLLSDQHGRISDDQAKKLEAVDTWLAEWEKL
jgi:hypothetical protein